MHRARRVLGDYSTVRATDDLAHVLADDTVHAVATATPAGTHLDVAMAALRAGKHVLVEKPLAAATAVNGYGVAHLAGACAASGARMIHISTDYVFPGHATEPYPEDAATCPVNAYGRSKLAGELAVTRLLPDTGYIVRTAWLYGEHGPNFVATVLRLAEEREWLDVVSDHRGQPAWSYRLAEQLVTLADAALAGRAAPGAYHGTAFGETTWYGLARAVFTLRGLDPARIRPTTSDRYRRPAPRPAYSVLGHERWAAASLRPPGDWRSALAQALAPAPRPVRGAAAAPPRLPA